MTHLPKDMTAPQAYRAVMQAYSKLRGEMRDILGECGILTNPRSADSDILKPLATFILTSDQVTVLGGKLEGGDRKTSMLAYEGFRGGLISIIEARLTERSDRDAASIMGGILAGLTDEKIIQVMTSLTGIARAVNRCPGLMRQC